MATKTRRQSYRKPGRGGGRITRGRTTRGGGRSAKPGGPMGLLNQIGGQIGGRGGRGGRGANKGGGLATKASSFVSGFLGGGGKSGRRRR